MGWIEKGEPTPFDEQAIPGLYFLNGDALAREFHQDWTKGQKFPTIVFPSGEICDLWESSDPGNGIVHIFGEMDLPLRDSRDTAIAYANSIAEQVGYVVQPHGEQGIEVYGDSDEHVVITYDNDQRLIANVVYIREQHAERPRPELLDQKTRETLPPLYSGEELGLEALVRVKFFLPGTRWTWYVSEGSPVDENGYFDTDKEKVDFLFFGLVDGDELELGYFSYAELTGLRGLMGLPVERDQHFEPKTLRELKTLHEQHGRHQDG